jgi:hypothetical protein
MKSGLLWYDASSNPIERKIADAAKRYYDKFGIKPDTCFVNEKDLTPGAALAQIKITPKRTILPNHVWVGLANK